MVNENLSCDFLVVLSHWGAKLLQILHTSGGKSEEAAACVERSTKLNRSGVRQHVVDHFSQERMVAGYLEVYRKIPG